MHVYFKQQNTHKIRVRIFAKNKINLWGHTTDFIFFRRGCILLTDEHGNDQEHWRYNDTKVYLSIAPPDKNYSLFSPSFKLKSRTPFFIDSMRLGTPLIDDVKNAYRYIKDTIPEYHYKHDWEPFHNEVRETIFKQF